MRKFTAKILIGGMLAFVPQLSAFATDAFGQYYNLSLPSNAIGTRANPRFLGHGSAVNATGAYNDYKLTEYSSTGAEMARTLYHETTSGNGNFMAVIQLDPSQNGGATSTTWNLGSVNIHTISYDPTFEMNMSTTGLLQCIAWKDTPVGMPRNYSATSGYHSVATSVHQGNVTALSSGAANTDAFDFEGIQILTNAYQWFDWSSSSPNHSDSAYSTGQTAGNSPASTAIVYTQAI